MNQVTNTVGVDETAPDAISRRALLTRVALAGLGAAGALGASASAQTADPPRQAGGTPQQPAAETGKSYPMAKPTARTEKEFRTIMMRPAMLSLATSKIAVDKATDPMAKEFANFELREAIGVTGVLKSMGTPEPPMDAAARASLAKLQGASGAAFDREYMTAQLATHEFLRDLAESYLANSSAGATAAARSMPEMHGRHIATLSLATIKEHIVHCKNFLRGAGAGAASTGA
jgi:putative membrane protein